LLTELTSLFLKVGNKTLDTFKLVSSHHSP
jgi:hypothetical protein